MTVESDTRLLTALTWERMVEPLWRERLARGGITTDPETFKVTVWEPDAWHDWQGKVTRWCAEFARHQLTDPKLVPALVAGDLLYGDRTGWPDVLAGWGGSHVPALPQATPRHLPGTGHLGGTHEHELSDVQRAALAQLDARDEADR